MGLSMLRHQECSSELERRGRRREKWRRRDGKSVGGCWRCWELRRGAERGLNLDAKEVLREKSAQREEVEGTTEERERESDWLPPWMKVSMHFTVLSEVPHCHFQHPHDR